MIIKLHDDFARAWEGRDVFAQVGALKGTVYRDMPSRRTLQFTFEGRHYFAKFHYGVGWREIIKNLLVLKLPVLGADNEWCAIRRLKELGVETMTSVGFGSRGFNPARRESFILTEAIENAISLEDYCATWPQQPPLFAVKLRLLREIANISGTLHSHGICHRDYYLCHFLLHDQDAFGKGKIDKPRLSLIDLHRAMIRRRLATRWVVKDIAGLYFSALHIGLKQRDFLRFVKLYSGKSLRQALKDDQSFWKKVEERAMALDQKINSQAEQSTDHKQEA
ncbi:MAG: lipopolysaccharide core heptose(I) kinase RfaP [Pseudomonas sp.]